MLYSEYYKLKCTDCNLNYKFIKWIDRVEKLVYNKFGFGLLDLPDQSYMILFEEGYSVQQMVSQVLLYEF